MSDQEDYQDYQDYLEYQKHLASAKPVTVAPGAGAFGRVAQPSRPPTPEEASQAGQGAMNQIPLAGGAVGGLAAGIPGAMAGAATGSMLKNLLSGDKSDALPAIGQVAKDSVTQGLLPETGGRALSGLAGLIGKGASTAGDVLMQKAVGLKKYIPGVGKEFAEQGLVGTKGMMRSQTERGLEKTGQEIADLAKTIPMKIDNAPVADKIADLAKRRILSTGEIPVEEAKTVGQILGKAREVAQDVPRSGQEMAELRQIAGRRARESGAYKTVPSAQLKSQLAGAEQAGRSEALKKAYSESFPESPNLMADADKTYSTFSKAKEALNQPESLSPINTMLKALPSSAVMSGASQGVLLPSGRMLESKTLQEMLRQLPRSVQSSEE